MLTFEEYLTKPSALSLESMLSIYTRLMDSYSKCTDEDKESIFADYLDKAVRYANTRAEWEMMDKGAKQADDESRTLLHNSLISATNILKRLFDLEGLDTTWRDDLSDIQGYERKRIGDFACFVAFMAGISNR